MRTCGFSAFLELFGYPGAFPAAGPPEKEFLDVYGWGPVYALRVEYQDGMQRLLRGSKKSGNAQRKSPGISAFACVAFD